MAAAYIRQARLDIAPPGIGIDRLRLQFELRSETQGDPPPSTITITNLAESTAAQIVKDATVRLSAGYLGRPLDQIHVGSVTQIDEPSDGHNRLTVLTLGPTSQAHRAAVIVSRAYEGVVSLRTVVADIAGQLGVPVGSLDAVPDLAIEDYTNVGKAEDALTALLRPRGVEWYEAGGELNFRKRGVADSRVGFVLSESTGMIDAPERTERGVIARMRLNALVRLNQRVRIESRRVSGAYKIFSLAHVGDTWDGPWETTIEAITI